MAGVSSRRRVKATHTASPKDAPNAVSRFVSNSDAAATASSPEEALLQNESDHRVMFAVLRNRTQAVGAARVCWDRGDVDGGIAHLQSADAHAAAGVVEAAMTRISTHLEQFPSPNIFQSDMEVIDTQVTPLFPVFSTLLSSDSEWVLTTTVNAVAMALVVCSPTLAATPTGSASKRKQKQLLNQFADLDAPLMSVYTACTKGSALHGSSKQLLKKIRKFTRA